MIHRDNSKEKQGEDKEEILMSHQMFHGSCLITRIRRRKRKIKHTFLV
jgi:hypothetical protein